SGASVVGSVITVTDNTEPAKTQNYTLQSGQTSHTFNLVATHNCTVSLSAKAGFDAPLPITFVAVGGSTRNLTMEYLGTVDIGYKIQKANSDPFTRVSYLSGSSGYTPAKMNYGTGTWEWGSWESFAKRFFKPCMLNYNGTVAYYLDPNDQTKKADGTPSDISDMGFAGNAMVEVKKLYTYEYEDATYSYHMVSSAKLDANYVAYPFTNASGVEKDFAYFPMFEGSLDGSNRMRSIAGQTISASKTGQQEIDYVNNNGAGYYTDYWSAHNFMAVMHTLLGKSTDSQTVFGQGNTSSSGAIQTGTLKSFGGFFGYSNTTSCVKTFWMENNWGNIFKRCMGVVTDGSSNLLVKMTAPYNSTGSGYTNLGATPANGYIKNITASNNGYEPIDTTGSATTYFCDYFYKSATCYGTVSGAWSFGSYCGCFFLYVFYAFSVSGPGIGCRPFFINP
ncbi:MAG: hypothetical protein RR285_12795, partial [Acinetobacter sp.]